MLIDGLRLTKTAQVQDTKIAAGTVFPTGVQEGTTFLLTATVGLDQPGMYVYVDAAWAPIGTLKSIQADAASMSVAVSNGEVTISLKQAMTPYDIASFTPGKPDAGVKVCELKSVRAFKLPAGLTGSFATVAIAPTGSSAVFNISKNGSSIGSFTFAVGSTNATFSFATQQTLNAGDVLAVTAPASQNAALSDLTFTLAGNLQ